MDNSDILFPYEKIRDEQKTLIYDVKEAIKNKKNILIHAPTGLGKTIGVLGPALKDALNKDRTVFFLTSRHTQHILALKTIRDICQKFDLVIRSCDIIAKKWMCCQDGAENMPSSEFNEYCKALREDELCEFYLNVKRGGKVTVKAQQVLDTLKAEIGVDTETINRLCRHDKLCPYEMASMLAREAHIIIADYNYLFNANIRDNFLIRANKKIENSIVVIDEGHNLPDRSREMMSEKLSNFILDRAIKEAEKFKFDLEAERLGVIFEVIKELASELDEEKDEDYVFKRDFFKKIDTLINYEETKEKLINAGDEIREKQRMSYVGSVGLFMNAWTGDDKGYTRVINIRKTKYGDLITLHYRCLDPSLVTKDVINKAVSTIIMSGTLTPVEMYADLLGFKNYEMREYKDPFSEKNRLNIIVEEVTTKFSARNSEQYKRIAEIVSDIVNTVPGNSFVFFPSYDVRNYTYRYLESKCSKKIFLELTGMSKEEKKDLLEKFKAFKNDGAVMLGVATGSFGEGVDLPGDFLKCVIVVGIPLQKPDLETKELMSYYEEKYGQGVNYGYIYPAVTMVMQNAGRCIRSEKDRGVIVFMDARYAWENYKKCFPKEWNMRVTKMWKERIVDFFKKDS